MKCGATVSREEFWTIIAVSVTIMAVNLTLFTFAFFAIDSIREDVRALNQRTDAILLNLASQRCSEAVVADAVD